MNYDPVKREVVGSVDHSEDIPQASYVGCCGFIHDHHIEHGRDCRCVGTVPDIEGRDILPRRLNPEPRISAPQELAQVVSYGDGSPRAFQGQTPKVNDWPSMGDDNYDPPSMDDVNQRIAERSMWALEEIAHHLKILVQIYQDDANG